MKVSASIASSDLLRIAEEVQFANRHFDDIHLDVADGVAVREISFGLEMCRRIRGIARLPMSLHLEVSNPVSYAEQVKQGGFDVVFIQTDCLTNAEEVIRIYQEKGIPTGVNLSNLDLRKKNLENLLERTTDVLINTTCHDDEEQRLRMDMLDYAIRLARETDHRVWVDGGISWNIAKELQKTDIYAVVMGRAIFSDKEKAVEAKEEEKAGNF